MFAHPAAVNYPALTDTLWYDEGTPQPFGFAAQNTWLQSFFRGTIYGTEQPNPRLFDTPSHFDRARDASHNNAGQLSRYAQQAYTKQQGYGDVL